MRGARVSWLSVQGPPSSARGARVSWLEAQGPRTDRRGARLAWIEAEVNLGSFGIGPRAIVTFAALELPSGTGLEGFMGLDVDDTMPAGGGRIRKLKTHSIGVI